MAFDLESAKKSLAVFRYRSDPVDATQCLSLAIDEVERLKAELDKAHSVISGLTK